MPPQQSQYVPPPKVPQWVNSLPDNPQGNYDFRVLDPEMAAVKGYKVNGKPGSAWQAYIYVYNNLHPEGKIPTVWEPQPPPTEKPNSVPGGAVRGARDLFQGVSSLIPDTDYDANHPDVAAKRMAAPLVNLYEASKTTAKQSREQWKRGEHLRSLISGVSTAVPFVNQSVATSNELVDEGRSAEASGRAIFDIITLLPGLKGGAVESKIRKLAGMESLAEKAATKQVNRLVAGTGEVIDPQDFRKVLTEINDTARAQKRPNTPESLKDVLTEAKRGIDNQFNMLLHPMRNTPVVPTQISQELGQLAHSPALTEAAAAGDREAIATIRYLNQQVVKWSRPYTLSALNDMRSSASAARHSLHEATIERQGAKIRGDVDAKIEGIIEKGLKDTVYGAIGARYPKVDVRGLKLKQSVLMSLESDVAEQAKKIRTKQAGFEGQTIRQKLRPSLYAHPSGTGGGSIHGIQNIIAGGPGKAANAAIKRAFPSRLAQLKSKALGKTFTTGAALSPKDRRRSLEAQLNIAQKTGDKAWAKRIEVLLSKEKEGQ